MSVQNLKKKQLLVLTKQTFHLSICLLETLSLYFTGIDYSL